MSFNKIKYRPICIVQQEMLYLIEQLPASEEKDKLLERVKEAHAMAKKMDAKLKEYNRAYNAIWQKKFKPIEMRSINPDEKQGFHKPRRN